MSTGFEVEFPMPIPSADRQARAQAIISQWKRVTRFTLGAFFSLLLVFPPIVLAAHLTGSRGLTDFRRGDWQIFICMAVTVGVGFLLFFLSLRARFRANAEHERLLQELLRDSLS